MPKVEVIRPWNGVKKGQTLVMREIPAALQANVREIAEPAATAGSSSVDAAVEQALEAARGKVVSMLDDARSQGEEIASAARREAEAIVSKARNEADQILAQARAAGAPLGQLAPATPPAAAGTGPTGKERRALIVARLKELKIEFDGRGSADELAALLPPDELKALFPTE